jgi:hypothetical protein
MMILFFPDVCLNHKLCLNTGRFLCQQSTVSGYFKYFIRRKKGIFKKICLYKNATGLILRSNLLNENLLNLA